MRAIQIARLDGPSAAELTELAEPDNADDVAIVTAIIQMGRSLQLQTVAEGVETQAQIELLAGLGCDLMQGFVVSAPLDAEATERWLRR